MPVSNPPANAFAGITRFPVQQWLWFWFSLRRRSDSLVNPHDAL